MSCCQNNQSSTAKSDACSTPTGRTIQPTVDIFETPEDWVVVADVPGASRDQLELAFDDGVLTLRAEVPARQPGQTQFLAHEYRVGAYERRFRIGEGIDPARITAALESGVLTIRMPKADSAKPRKIQISNN